MIEKVHKVFIHVECPQGTGEIKLSRQLADALLEKNVEVSVASSNLGQFYSGSQNIEIVDIPKIIYDKDNWQFNIYDQDGNEFPLNSEEGQKLQQQRKDILVEQSKKVDAFIDMTGWPIWLGDEIFDGEKLDYIEEISESEDKPLLLACIREVIHANTPAVKGDDQLAIDIINQHFDKVLVLGDGELIHLRDSVDNADDIDPQRLEHVGYPVKPFTGVATDNPNGPEVIVSMGGGDFSQICFDTIKAAIEARKHSTLSNNKWNILIGKNYPEDKIDEIKQLVAEQPNSDGIKLLSTMPPEQFNAMIQQNPSPVMIGQCGAGVACDIFRYGLKAVVVPIADYSGVYGKKPYIEQVTRANVMQQKGMAVSVDPTVLDLDIEKAGMVIADKIDTACQLTPELSSVKLNGAENAANTIIGMIKERVLQKYSGGHSSSTIKAR